MKVIAPYRENRGLYAQRGLPARTYDGDQVLLAKTCITFGKRVENKEISKEQSDYYHANKAHLLELLHRYDARFVLPDDEEMLAISHNLKRTYTNNYQVPNADGSFNYNTMHQMPAHAFLLHGF